MPSPPPGWFDLHSDGFRYGRLMGWVLMTLAVIRLWPESHRHSETDRTSEAHPSLEVWVGMERYDVALFKKAETWWIPPPLSDIPPAAREACTAGRSEDLQGGSFAVVEVGATELRLQGRTLPDAWVSIDAEGHASVPMLVDALDPLLHFRKVQGRRLPCTAAHVDRVLVALSSDVPIIAISAVLRSVTMAGGLPDVLAVDAEQLRRLQAGEPLRWQKEDRVRLGTSFEVPDESVPRDAQPAAGVHPGLVVL